METKIYIAWFVVDNPKGTIEDNIKTRAFTEEALMRRWIDRQYADADKNFDKGVACHWDFKTQKILV